MITLMPYSPGLLAIFVPVKLSVRGVDFFLPIKYNPKHGPSYTDTNVLLLV